MELSKLSNEALLEMARQLADEKVNFDDKFLTSLEEWHLEKNFLTPNQRDSLINIITGFN